MLNKSGRTGRGKVLVWQWGQRGAGPRFAAEAAAALEELGFDVTLSLSREAEAYESLGTLCPRMLPFAGRAPRRSGVRVLLELPGQLRRLSAALRREQPEVGVCAMIGYWDIPFALLLRGHGVRLVSVVHEVERHPGDIHVVLYLLQRLMIRLSDCAVTLSAHVTQTVRRRWPNLPLVEAAHPPFLFRDLALRPPVPLAVSSAPLRLLVAGRMRGYKGVARALDAFARLPSGAAQLRIVGDGNAVPGATQRRDAGVSIDNRWLSEAELVAEIDAADLVLFPYDEASQSGLVPLCLARGRPVVVTPVGGLAEQVRPAGAGLVAADTEAESFAGAIMQLCEDRDALPRMSALAMRDNDPVAGWHELAERLATALVLSEATGEPSTERA